MFTKHHFIAFFIFVIIFGGAAWLYPTWADYHRAKRRLVITRRDVRQQEMHNDSLREDIRRLKTESLSWERVARDKFGWCRKGEKVYEFKNGR